ncbi:hypothetical protein BHE74_00022458 [Ensete ventricosum]|nr:hypothetical protein BHE74_00022458 [Ensete ventricosum]
MRAGSNGGRGSIEGTLVAEGGMAGSGGRQIGRKSHKMQRRNKGEVEDATAVIGDDEAAAWLQRGDGGTTADGSDWCYGRGRRGLRQGTTMWLYACGEEMGGQRWVATMRATTGDDEGCGWGQQYSYVAAVRWGDSGGWHW